MSPDDMVALNNQILGSKYLFHDLLITCCTIGCLEQVFEDGKYNYEWTLDKSIIPILGEEDKDNKNQHYFNLLRQTQKYSHYVKKLLTHFEEWIRRKIDYIGRLKRAILMKVRFIWNNYTEKGKIK